MPVRLLRYHFEEERMRTKPAALHQKRALTLASLGPSFGDVSIGHRQTPSHNSLSSGPATALTREDIRAVQTHKTVRPSPMTVSARI